MASSQQSSMSHVLPQQVVHNLWGLFSFTGRKPLQTFPATSGQWHGEGTIINTNKHNHKHQITKVKGRKDGKYIERSSINRSRQVALSVTKDRMRVRAPSPPLVWKWKSRCVQFEHCLRFWVSKLRLREWSTMAATKSLQLWEGIKFVLAEQIKYLLYKNVYRLTHRQYA